MKVIVLLVLFLGMTLSGCAASEGEEVYKANCAGCHSRGVAGAPAIGDDAAWEARIARGEDTLIARSINGYTGKSGIMPARGGNSALTDAQVAAATRYLIQHSQ